MVHAWYFCAWLWNDGIPGTEESTVSVWHSRHSKFTFERLSSRGFEEPWGVWQLTQPSVFTGTCSNTNGPAFSAWHLKQPASCAAVERSCLVRNPPCGLWQSLQPTSPSFTRW